MEKIKQWKTIHFHQMDEYPTWKDIKDIQFEDDDRIRISYEEPSHSDDGGWVIEVERHVEEPKQDNEESDFIKRCIKVYWEYHSNRVHPDNQKDWNISQNILNKLNNE